MENVTMTRGTSPLGIYITGTGEYVRNELAHLQDYMDNVEFTDLEDLRQSYEN